MLYYSLFISFSISIFSLFKVDMKTASLRKTHGVKGVRIRSYFGPHFSGIFRHSDLIRRNTQYLSVFGPNAGKSGKNADQNNSEYGLFLRSDMKSVRT